MPEAISSTNASAKALPDPGQVFDLIEAFRRSKTMFTAASMGIFDLLETGPMNSADVAAHLKSDPDATARLLEACVGLGLLMQGSDGFSNAPAASTYLTKASEHTMLGYVLYSDSALYPMWAHLEEAVREGTPRWQQTFGTSGPLFNHFFSTDEKMRTFVKGMHGFGILTSPSVVRAFDLSGFHTLADLGAATGHLTTAACEAWPNLRGVVFDMEKVVALAREEVGKSPAANRISLQAGDFFADALPPANLYALGRILHDWTEPKIKLLLSKIFESLPSGGGLLIAEKLLHPDKSGPVHVQMQSLNMLICTEGKERTLEEYRALLEAAGFRDVEGRHTGKAVDAVLARKA